MKLSEFNKIIGKDSYVRCQGKERIDPKIVSLSAANNHLFAGGSIGWWVRKGYIVVDVDEGKEQVLKVIAQLGVKTLMCKTPKGVHLYFKTDKEYPQKVGMVLPFGLKCDFRCAEKGYVLLPYSLNNRMFNSCDTIADLPIEFTPLMDRKDSLLDKRDGEGRNNLLFAHLMAYKNKGASITQIEQMAYLINNYIFADAMHVDELRKIVESTKKYKAQPLCDNPYLITNAKGQPTQVNNRAIVDYFVNRGDIFVLGGDAYLYKNGVYQESGTYIRSAIKEMISLDSFITQAKIMECYRLLVDDIRIQRKDTELNSDPNLINFKNGIWNIQKKELMPHDSKYLQSLQIPNRAIPIVRPWKDTRLYSFLNTQVEMPVEDIEMLMQYMAYCLTTSYGLKTFMILQGKSNTGKSVLVRFFEALVGHENTAALSMQELSMRFYPSQLYNRLLNSCADNGSMPLSSIENLKKITGGDQVMHERKGKEPFFFTPFTKLLFSFNQLPLQLEEKSNAFYKRMRILSMQKELFLNDEYVNALCSREGVEEVIPHLLQRLPVNSIPTTPTSNGMIEHLRQDSDSIHAFMFTQCKLRGTTSKKDLYEAYVAYCIQHGREAHKKHSFMRHMRTQGFNEVRDNKSKDYVWNGISIVTD